MAYDNIISRQDAQAMIPEDVADGVIQGAIEQSAALTLFSRVPMSRAQRRLPVLAALPTAYFVNGDTGLKQTTEVSWANKYLDAEELAAIVPIPEAVLDDSSFDVWGSIKPLLQEAIGRALDGAVFFGTNKPGSWPDAIADAAAAANNTFDRGTSDPDEGGIAGDISETMALVENDGFDANGFVAVRSMKGRLRQARSTQGERLTEIGPNGSTIDGVAVQYPMRGLWGTSSGDVELFTGDFSQGLIGVRRDITYKVLDQAVIQDNTGAIVYNLAQQDMVALRVVARFAFQVPNPLNHDQPEEDDRYPFATLLVP